MKRLAVLAVASLMAVTAVTTNPRPAEARRGGAVIAGLIGGIALGAILAHRHRKRHTYYYRTDRPYYYYGGYYRPYRYEYVPRRTYRVYRHKHRWHRW